MEKSFITSLNRFVGSRTFASWVICVVMNIEWKGRAQAIDLEHSAKI